MNETKAETPGKMIIKDACLPHEPGSRSKPSNILDLIRVKRKKKSNEKE